MSSPKDFDIKTSSPDWCPGCGDFGIWNAMKMAFAEMELKPENIVLIAGIGCSGKLPHWMNTYGFHGLHGRALPVALGAKVTNHKLNVIINGGDGDGYGIGMGHFIHAMRTNINVTYIVHNNQIYGLTKGQASPTSALGDKTVSTPFGVIDTPINPMTLALAAGCTFVSRGMAGDLVHLKEVLIQAINHRGFSLVDVLQPCVTYNKVNTYAWGKEVTYKLDSKNHDASNLDQAWQKAHEWGEKVPVGVIYQEKRPTYEDNLPQLAEQALVDQEIRNIDITKLIERLK